MTSTCMLCAVHEADAFFQRRRVWEDDLWRLSVVLRGAIPSGWVAAAAQPL